MSVDASRATSFAVLAAALAAFALVTSWLAPFTPDDAFISYRYAENLAAGHGLVFNAEQPPVEGFTNLLWILACAAAARAGIPATTFGPLFGWACGAASIVAAWSLLRPRVAAGRSSIPLLLLALSAPPALYAVSGMETTLFELLLVAATASVAPLLEDRARGGTAHTAALVAFSLLLALCRPEGAVFFGVALVALLLAGRRVAALAAAAAFAAAFLAYTWWRVRYFGGWLPTPLLSKGGGGESIAFAWRTNLRQYLVVQNQFYAPLGYYYLGLGGAALAGAWAALRARRVSLETFALAVAVAYAAVYVSFVDWMPGMRYHAPLVPLLLLAAAGLLRRRPAGEDAGGGGASRAAVAVAAPLLALNLFVVAVLAQDRGRLQRSTDAALVALGRWMHDAIPRGTLLGVSDVGAIPYYSGLPTLDTNPHSLTDLRSARHGWSADYFFERAPGVAAFVSFSLDRPEFYPEHRALVGDPRFRARYVLLGVTRYDWHRDRCFWVFADRDLALDPAQVARLPRGLE